MAYSPENNPYIPGDPYSYDLRWMVDKINEWKDPLDSAERAEAAEAAAKASEGQAEAWAKGTIDGDPVTADDPQYQNNSKYWSDEAADLVDNVEDIQDEVRTDLRNQNDAINVLEARMDTFASLPPGSTSGNAELLDIRVAADGTTYPSAGDAVRGQVDYLDDAVHNILPGMTKFLKEGKNLFIPYTLKIGIQISTNTLEEVSNVQYDSSGFIPVESGVTYIIRYMSYLFYYDTNKDWVSTDANTYQTNYSFTPSQDGYIRFSNNVVSDTNRYNTEHNIIAEDADYYLWMPYEYDFDEYYAGFNKYIKSINLIDTLTNGYIRRSDGNIASPTSNYRSSNYIKIDPDTYYYWYNVRPDFGGFYDKLGAYITTTGSLTNPFKASSYVTGATFVRVSGYNDQVVLSDRPFGKYVPIGQKKFDEDMINLNAPVDLDVFLPPDFYVNKGRTIEIFNETLISTPTTDDFHFRWIADKGTNFERKFVFTSNAVEDVVATLMIYDKWYNVIYEGSTTIHVVDALSTPKTIVPIGDSLTNGKPWLRYIAEDLAGSGVTFTGTRWNGTGTSISASIKHEGRSGWRASQYTGNNVYTFDANGVSSANPFYDTGNSRFSWDYYRTTYSISADGIQFFLGTNGLALAPQAEENAMYAMVNFIRTEDPSIPIFICYPIHAADQNGCARQANIDGYSAAQGMFYPERKQAMWNFIKRLYTRCSSFSNVYFVPICQCFDHEYMFGITDVPVNQYSAITEPMPTEGIHPSDYHQFIDPMYGAYCYAFN